MLDMFETYEAYRQIVESGDKSSSKYWAARENYEDSLRMALCFEPSKASAFAATMMPPYTFNVESF